MAYASQLDTAALPKVASTKALPKDHIPTRKGSLRLFPPRPVPSPWISCSDIVRVQGEKIGNQKNSRGHGQRKVSLGHRNV